MKAWRLGIAIISEVAASAAVLKATQMEEPMAPGRVNCARRARQPRAGFFRSLTRYVGHIVWTCAVGAATATQGYAQSAALLTTDVAVPMRDGVVLRADVLMPNQGGPFPVLVYRTPYGKKNARAEYQTFEHAVERGYAVVIQDVRGRYGSDGDFVPYQNEGRDGFDTIEWAARQPWSNGAIGTFGLSYPGAVQWLAAVQTPPHLKAMAPAMTFSNPENFFYAGGTWDMSWIDWIWFNIAPDVREKRGLAGPKTYAEAAASWSSEGPRMQGFLPLAALPQLRLTAPYYYNWLAHPPQDPWWDWAELRNKYDRNHAAVLNLSAWYDDNYGPEGATTNFSGLLRARRGQTEPATHLLLGPWVHGVESTAATRSGEREFGPKAAIAYDELVLRWMDHYVRGIDNSVEREAPVRYFVMGKNEWREAATWPPPATLTTYYLSPKAGKNKAGVLTTTKPRASTQSTSFVADPANPVVNQYSASGAHDYRALVDRPDVLTFDTAPLEQDTEVTGPIHAQVFVACDCRDLDLWVRLLDVAPDGTALNLMSPGLDVQRASNRVPTSEPQWLAAGKVYPIELDNLMTSNSFPAGHRIRVQISASFYPNFSRNLQNGSSEVHSANTHKATITVLSGAMHASQISLPVVVSH